MGATEHEREILDAAARLFERYGYKKTTVEDIANEAGIGKGSVYLRFASKEEIGMAWLHELHKHLFAEVTATERLDAKEKIADMVVKRVMSRFDIFTRHRSSLDEVLCSLAPKLAAKKKEVHEREARHLQTLIEAGVADGTLRSVDPLGDARAMIVATNSLLPYSYRPEEIGDRASVEAQAKALADLFVRALEISHA